MSRATRRAVLRSTAAAVATGIAVTGTTTAATNGWRRVDSPTGESLNGVTLASNGPWAAGGGGDVLERTSDGWVTRLEYGPDTGSNELTCIDSTGDGRRVWFAGGNGVVGEMDAVTKTLTNHREPQEAASSWEGIAVTGDADTDEVVSLVNGSGEELTGYRRADGSIEWTAPTKPGSGSTITAVDHYSRDAFVCCDTNASVFESLSAGDSWSKVGIEGAGANFYGVAAVAANDIDVCGDSGMLYHWDGSEWVGRQVGENAINGIDRLSEAGLAAGGSGYVFRREALSSWERVATPTGNNLSDAALGGEVHPDVAVGASGTILEKQG